MARLEEDVVRRIKALLGIGYRPASIARAFGLRRETISLIKNRKTHADVRPMEKSRVATLEIEGLNYRDAQPPSTAEEVEAAYPELAALVRAQKCAAAVEVPAGDDGRAALATDPGAGSPERPNAPPEPVDVGGGEASETPTAPSAGIPRRRGPLGSGSLGRGIF